MDELIVDARVCNLDMVVRFVAERLSAVGCSVKQQAQITIAVEEVFVNIAYYAYGGKSGGATIRISINNDEYIVIEFEDGGKPYNPFSRENPDVTAGVEKREIGGLGVYMVKKLMDSAEYRRDGGKNVLTLRKKLVGVRRSAFL